MSTISSQAKRLKWKKLIEEQSKSGLSIEKWCLQNQVALHTFRYWRKRLSLKPLERSSFQELSPKCLRTISFETQGFHVRISNDCEPHFRKQIFALLQEWAC